MDRWGPLWQFYQEAFPHEYYQINNELCKLSMQRTFWRVISILASHPRSNTWIPAPDGISVLVIGSVHGKGASSSSSLFPDDDRPVNMVSTDIHQSLRVLFMIHDTEGRYCSFKSLGFILWFCFWMQRFITVVIGRVHKIWLIGLFILIIITIFIILIIQKANTEGSNRFSWYMSSRTHNTIMTMTGHSCSSQWSCTTVGRWGLDRCLSI